MTARAEHLAKRTPRDLVEALLLEHFSANLSPSRRQSAREESRNIFSQSSNFPGGLVYRSKRAIFGVDITFRLDNPVTPCVRIISPRGERWREAVGHFADRLLDLIPEAELVVDGNSYKITY